MRQLLTLALVSLFVVVASPISEAQNSSDLEGQPSTLREGALASYWIWRDTDGYHLRTTTAHDRRVFSGRIEFSGGSGWAKAYRLGPKDEVQVTNQGITFHLSNQRELKGFDFRMDHPTQAALSLELDDDKGQKVAEHVLLGRNNAHPKTNPFTIATAAERPSAQGLARPSAQARLMNPPVRIPGQEFASIDFASTPSGAEILIDGSFVGDTPSRLRVPAGRHTIAIRLSGYETWTQSIQVEPGSQATIQRTLKSM
jgi:PEGA domain